MEILRRLDLESGRQPCLSLPAHSPAHAATHPKMALYVGTRVGSNPSDPESLNRLPYLSLYPGYYLNAGGSKGPECVWTAITG